MIVGYDNSDDAAVIRLQGDKFIIQTVDFFTPIVDDPYLFGQIAATNALSDIYAMGGKPLFALNIVGFPTEKLKLDILSDILNGGIDKCKEINIPIIAIPILNVDGYRSGTRVNSHGVDLNRNLPSKNWINEARDTK